MQVELSRVEKSYSWARLRPILVLNLILNLTALAWTPNATAQVSRLESAEGEISGTVLLESGSRPASQVAVSLKSRVAGIFRSVLTDLEGHFKVRDLPQGTYDIAVDEEGYESTQTSAQLDGPSTNLVVYLKSKSVPISRSNYTVSVRELKIPGKARNEFEKGLDHLAKNDLAGGLSHLTKATQLFPGYFEAYYDLGVAEAGIGREDEAMKDFETAIELSGGRYASPEFGVGYLLCKKGKLDESEKIVRRGLEVDDTKPDGYVILSETLLRLNRVEEAEKSAQEALLRNPNFAAAYLALSDADAIKGDHRAEMRDLDAYLKLQPNGAGSALARQLREAALKILAKSNPQD